jgi:transcriptional regulator CtsR
MVKPLFQFYCSPKPSADLFFGFVLHPPCWVVYTVLLSSHATYLVTNFYSPLTIATMKKNTKQLLLPALKYGFLCFALLVLSCSKQVKEDLKPPETSVNGSVQSDEVVVTISNPGFESDKTSWGDPNLFAISTSDKHSGLKSAKLGSSGDKFEQAVTVTANTDYVLKAWIYQKGTLGAKAGATVLGSISVNSTAGFTQQTVNFNSGSATSITLYGSYNGGTGRFDDFTLETSGTPATPPTAPSALAASASGLTINLTWTDNSTDETGFKIERKTGTGGTYAEIVSNQAANSTSYANTGLTAGTTYYYRIRAYNAAGNSSYTSEVSATTLTAPTAPSGLSATAAGTTINLAWTDNSSNESGFKIERKTGAGGTYAEIVSNQAANSTSYSNTNLAASTTYYYRIRSYNAAGNSAYSAEASATTASTGGNLPANVLNLTNWKITLPINSSGTQTGSTPLEVTQPNLATYEVTPYFHNNANNTGVIFQANTGGVTTSGSNYPRSELREMTNNGASNASWSSTSGTHTMEIDQAITHLPVVKQHIVAGQIHDASDDVIVFRLEGTKLFMDHNGADGTTLDANYVLGTRFTVKFVVTGGQVMSYYNGVLKETYTKSFSGAYFKAGAYTQSSCKSGGNPGPTESCSAYGEVVIYNVTVTHQ